MVKEAMTLPAGVGSVVLAGIERQAQVDGVGTTKESFGRALMAGFRGLRSGGFGGARTAYRGTRNYLDIGKQVAKKQKTIDRLGKSLTREGGVARQNRAIMDAGGQSPLKYDPSAQVKTLKQQRRAAETGLAQLQAKQQQYAQFAPPSKAPKVSPGAKGAANPKAVADDAAKQAKAPAKQAKAPAKQLEEANTTATTQPDASDATGLRERIGNATKWVGEKAKESPFVAMGAAGGAGVLGGAALTGGGGGGRPAPPQAGWAQPGWG